MTQHHILDLVRQINPPTFSKSPHNLNGHRVVYSKREARLYKPSFLASLWSSGETKQYFVARFGIPKEVIDWQFHWSEGTSAISLDFDSRFVIQANEERQALRLVEALAETGEPGETLYSLINASLHQELERLLRDCNSKALSLLDAFRRSSTGTGESDDLNRKVSERLTDLLGGVYFRIGFTLKNAPPTQIEVQEPAPFILADSEQKHVVKTTALLQLSNYQAFKKSGLESEAAVQQTIARAIRKVAESLLFGQKYYDVVSSFKRGTNSVEHKMRERITAEASSIGYDLSMFQTFPDIAALQLLEPTRIDIPATDEKYYLANSTSYVQMSIALTVQIEQDFSGLHLLVNPDAPDVIKPIEARVKRICRDAIQKFNREQFNLNFQDKIIPAVETALTDTLRGYGLKTKVIHLHQAPTEDANRFMALRGRTIPFAIHISPHANVGDADIVSITGKVEVIGMETNSWERFEGKDFGFRQDSRITEGRLRQQAALYELRITEQTPLPNEERQALAIELELIEIRDRVVSTLTEAMSKIPNLAAHWRTAQGGQEIIKLAQELAMQTVVEEFGLTTALRSMQRQNTDTEITALMRRQSAHALARKLIEQDVDREAKLHEQADQHALLALKTAGSKKVEALDDIDNPLHDQVRKEVEARLLVNASTTRLTAESAAKLIEPTTPDPNAALPWQPAAKGEKGTNAVEPPSR